MEYKFEKLEVWQLSLELSDMIYEVTNMLPDVEKFNLKTQMIRAGTSISLNIAERSTSQTDKEQARFINYAIRSLIEVIACLRIMQQRQYLESGQSNNDIEELTGLLFKKLQAFKKSLK